MNEEFDEKKYRESFVEENISTGIAFQIRALRKKEKWSQEDLGEKAGKAQNVISRLENPDYGKFTLNTLLALAAAFDVGLMVRFVSFSGLRASLRDVSEPALAVPNFNEEKHAASSLGQISSHLEWASNIHSGVVNRQLNVDVGYSPSLNTSLSDMGMVTVPVVAN